MSNANLNSNNHDQFFHPIMKNSYPDCQLIKAGKESIDEPKLKISKNEYPGHSMYQGHHIVKKSNSL